MLTERKQSKLLERGYSRRDLGRVVTLLSAGAALPFYNEAAMAQQAEVSRTGASLPPGSIRISSNESPWGPSKAALDAIRKFSKDGNRYQYEETYDMVDTAAAAEGLTYENVIPYPGSSMALLHGVVSFVSPDRGLVTVDPGYEAAARAAEFVNAKVTGVPLKKDGVHDVKAMLAADPNAGLFYVCNPNNPTGTPTPRADIEWLIANKPEGSVVMLDEAYIHLSDEPFGTDLVAVGEDVLVLRTFSKLYAMAGLRAGLAIGRPDLIAEMKGWMTGALPVTAMVAAKASMLDTEFVASRKKMTAEIREDLLHFFDKYEFPYVASASNKVFVDSGRPTQEVIEAMRDELIYIGRAWPSWSTHCRVSIGTAPEMEKFKSAWLKVLRS